MHALALPVPANMLRQCYRAAARLYEKHKWKMYRLPATAYKDLARQVRLRARDACCHLSVCGHMNIH